MAEDYIPRVVMRPRRPVSPTPPPAADEKPKASKKDDKKNQPPPEPEPEPVLDENGGTYPLTTICTVSGLNCSLYMYL